MAVSGRLSALGVAKAAKPGRFSDGGGLYLQVTKTGTKSWLLRYMRNGVARHHGLGPLDLVSLAEARDMAREARKLLLSGVDPIAAKQQARAAARAAEAATMTFATAAERYIKSHKAGWKNAKHGDQWGASLKTYAEPVLGNVDVSKVDTGHVMKVLEPIWNEKPETASRVRGRIELILSWASARGYRSGENPARWRGHLDRLLPARGKVRKVKHFEALGIDDAPGFMQALRGNDAVSAKALAFTMLTAARTGEVINATWAEFDLPAKLWTVPAHRMKAGREHRVPLSAAAIDILEKLPREDGNSFVFIGGRKGAGLSNMAMLQLIRGMRPDENLTVHGLRSTFRDWAAERTDYPSELVEMALAHVVGDRTEAAYRRGDLLEKRFKLMEAWAGFVNGSVAGG